MAVTRKTEKDLENVSLHEHFETQLELLEKLLVGRFDNIDKSVKIAHDAMKKRLDGMNQIREQLRDQVETFCTRESQEISHSAIDKEIRDLREYRVKIEGMASQRSMNITLVIAIISAAVSIFSLIIRFIGK